MDGSSDSLLLDFSLPARSGLQLKELLYTGRTTLLSQTDYADFVVLKRLLWLNITSLTFVNGKRMHRIFSLLRSRPINFCAASAPALAIFPINLTKI
jgi:hypothetical protein